MCIQEQYPFAPMGGALTFPVLGYEDVRHSVHIAFQFRNRLVALELLLSSCGPNSQKDEYTVILAGSFSSCLGSNKTAEPSCLAGRVLSGVRMPYSSIWQGNCNLATDMRLVSFGRWCRMAVLKSGPRDSPLVVGIVSGVLP